MPRYLKNGPIGAASCALAAACVLAPAVSAQKPATAPTQESTASSVSPETHDDGLDDLVGTESGSLGSELLLFADIPVVVTSGRGAQPMSMSAAPVSVLTTEDIHFGGLTNIAEALRFIPGVDVTRMDRDRYGVGIRGLHFPFAERTLTLVDGRNVQDPFNGFTEWLSLPVFMDDIERIEVVRGPAGASWGANALNGVFNIITKDPIDTQGVLLSTRLNEFGDSYSNIRWGAAAGKWSWRLSAGWQQHENSDEAILGDNFTSHDFNRQFMIDTKAVYQASDTDKLSFGVAHTRADRAYSDYFSLPDPEENERLNTLLLFARYDHDFEGGGSMYTQWSGSYFDANRPWIVHNVTYSNNFEAQANLPKIDGHTLSFGGNFRWDNTTTDPQDTLTTEYIGVLNEYWFGGFVQDRWDIAPSFAAEGQFRLDHYSGTGFDWSGRLAGLYTPDGEWRHVLRIAAARAFRTLAPFDRVSVYVPYNVPPGNGIDNEGVWSLEAGYNGRLTDNLTLRADVYYQHYDDLIGYTITPDDLATATVLGDADGYGAEAELILKGEHAQASIWYAYHGFATDHPDQDTRAFRPPTSAVGATGRIGFGHGWTANANYRFSDRTRAGDEASLFTPPVAAQHRFDLTLAKSFGDGLGEVMVGVEDLFNKTEDAGLSAGFDENRLPGRTFFVRVQLKF